MIERFQGGFFRAAWAVFFGNELQSQSQPFCSRNNTGCIGLCRQDILHSQSVEKLWLVCLEFPTNIPRIMLVIDLLQFSLKAILTRS